MVEALLLTGTGGLADGAGCIRLGRQELVTGAGELAGGRLGDAEGATTAGKGVGAGALLTFVEPDPPEATTPEPPLRAGGRKDEVTGGGALDG
jgi:hypothetical protein